MNTKKRRLFFVIALCLAALTAAPSWAAINEVAPNSEHLFRVYVFDSNGPVKDVAIQFCDDTVCQIGKTDAQGMAAFDASEGKSYEVHVLKVPSGYEVNTETFKTLNVYSDVPIFLKKSN